MVEASIHQGYVETPYAELQVGWPVLLSVGQVTIRRMCKSAQGYPGIKDDISREWYDGPGTEGIWLVPVK